MQESDNLPVIVAVLSGVGAAVISLLVLAVLPLVFYVLPQTGAADAVLPGAPSSAQQDAVYEGSSHTSKPNSTDSSSAATTYSHKVTIPTLASIGLSQEGYIVGDFNAKVEECLQFPQLPGGCEIAAMTSVLRALGYETDLVAFTDDYVLKVEGEPKLVYSYSGSPYAQGAAFPPAMARAGNAYLKDQGSSWRFVEPEHATIDSMIKVTEMGRPVLLWTTMYGANPVSTSIVIEDYEWYSNEHCVVFFGLSEDGDMQIMDPLVGITTQNREQFEKIYDACGQHALVPSQTQTNAVDAAESKLSSSFAGEIQNVATQSIIVLLQ